MQTTLLLSTKPEWLELDIINPLNLNNKKQKVLIRINHTNGKVPLAESVLDTDRRAKVMSDKPY